MAEIPKKLEDWTLAIVRELSAYGQVESDRHDFKSNLSATDQVTKACCAFANSLGGFFVVGVKGARGKWLVEGIEPDSEIGRDFGHRLKASPTIPFKVGAPIEIAGSRKVLYVIEVPKSLRRPHLPEAPDKRFFWKRTGTGCEQMAREEIRLEFVENQERREKLGLLVIELSILNSTCKAAAKEDDSGGLIVVPLNTGSIRRLTIDAYPIIQANRHLVRALLALTLQADSVTYYLERRLVASVLPRSEAEGTQFAADYNGYVRKNANALSAVATFALHELRSGFEFEDPTQSGDVPILPLIRLEGNAGLQR